MTKVDLDAYKAAAKRVKAADEQLQRDFRAKLRDVAKPLGEQVIVEGAEEMPSRGGLRERLKTGRATVNASSLRVTLSLASSSGVHLEPINRGKLRHPVFAAHQATKRSAKQTALASDGTLKGVSLRKAVNKVRRKGWAWVGQDVPAGTYDKAFEGHKDEVVEQLVNVANEALKGIGS